MKETFYQTLHHFQDLFAEKRWLWGIVLGVLVSSATITYLVGSKLQSPTKKLSPPTLQNAPTLPEDAEDLTTLNILLLGYGGAGHAGGYLADVVQVMHLDFAQGLLALISVPRDSWVTLPSGTESKINAAYNNDVQSQDKQATTAKQMAQVVTGLPIDYFIAVDFVGFQRIIGEELGGIDVEVAQTMTDSWYPIKGEELNLCGLSPEEIAEAHEQNSGFELEKQFPCRYEELYFPAGTNRMEGGDALKYVRSRHGNPGGDFARGVRQQEVLVGIREKLFTLEGISNIPQVFQQFATHVDTDLDAELAQYLWPALKNTRGYQLKNINLSENVLTGGNINGASVVQPKESWEAVRHYVQNQLQTE